MNANPNNAQKQTINEPIKKLLWKISDSSYVLDLPCVLSNNHTLEVGMDYFLIYGVCNTPSAVKLLGIIEKGGYTHIHLEDNKTGVTFKISHIFPDDYFECCWFLIAMDFLIDTIIFHLQSEQNKQMLDLK